MQRLIYGRSWRRQTRLTGSACGAMGRDSSQGGGGNCAGSGSDWGVIGIETDNGS